VLARYGGLCSQRTAKPKSKSDKSNVRETSFMKTKIAERDAGLSAAYVCVAASGVVLLVATALCFGPRHSAGVALGVVLAVSNLWLIERVVRVYLNAQGGRWAAMALVKSTALFATVGLLVRTGAIEVLPLVAGFGALPVGVVLAGLWPVARPREEGS
jgi:hypothetical protein